jgi:hypothetical protein
MLLYKCFNDYSTISMKHDVLHLHKADCPQTTRTRANEGIIISAAERELPKTHVILRKNWNYSKQVLKVLLDN